MNLKKETMLALIFQQGGRLRNVMTTDSKDKVESLMKIFYDFPYYAVYFPLEDIKHVSNMITISNREDVQGDKLIDCDVNLTINEDYSGADMLRTISISGDELFLNDEPNGVLSPLNVDMNIFSAWVGMNVCLECDNGVVEIGPECSVLASDCCGGCYREEKCETCDGSGLINSNL